MPISHTPPHNDDAERAVLSTLLSYQEAYEKIGQVLKSSDFYHPANQVLYQAITDMKIENIVAVDVVTLIEYLKRKDLLKKAGGVGYVTQLSDMYSLSTNVESYAKIVKDNSLRRTLIRVAEEMHSKAYDESAAPFDSLNDAEKTLTEVSINSTINSSDAFDAKSGINEVISEILDKAEGNWVNTSVNTGYDMINKFTHGGFMPSNYIIIGARPSIGKSALAVSLIRNMLQKDYKVAFFSLEMPSKEIIMRLLATQSRIDLSKFFTGHLSNREIDDITLAAESIYQHEFYLIDESNMKLSDLVSRSRLLKREKDLDIIFIDYIGIIEAGLPLSTPRHEEIAYISKALKQLARELKIPVVVLCQLSRDSEELEPQLNNLRESGSIEQDADLVFLLHRRRSITDLSPEDEAKLITTPEGAKIQSSKLIVAKNRNGMTGTIYIGYNTNATAFENIDQDKSRFIQPERRPVTRK